MDAAPLRARIRPRAADDRDPDSRRQPVVVDWSIPVAWLRRPGWKHNPAQGMLRVTDHKTGRDRTKEGLIINGGETLQPVLYSMVVEQMTGKTVYESRLLFCTSAGGYKVRTVPLSAHNREVGLEALTSSIGPSRPGLWWRRQRKGRAPGATSGRCAARPKSSVSAESSRRSVARPARTTERA